MNHEMHNGSSSSFFGAFLFGAVVGGVTALLVTPCSGAEMRKKIGSRLNGLKKKGEELVEEAGSDFEDQVNKRSREHMEARS